MTWTDSGHPAAALLGLLLGVLFGALVPELIGRLPEPEPEPVAEPDPAATEEVEPAEPKELYATIGALSGLRWRSALAGGVLGAVLAASVGWSPALVLLLPLVGVGIALAVVDARTRLLPKLLVLPATGYVLLAAVAISVGHHRYADLERGLISFVVVRSIFWVLWWFRSSGMGFGDVRLAGLLGLTLGLLGGAELFVGIYAAFIIFVVPGLIIAVVRRDRGYLKSRVPFGPHLLLGGVIGVALGPWIAQSFGY